MLLNLNIGLLGHVDSGKTSLAKALSETSGTAAFDKHPQSQERGITIDLGFSSLVTAIPDKLKENPRNKYDFLQFTFVDCPGHASLIKTIIGGAQIIDFMILVVDIGKGIQTQTSECIVIGELTCKRMIIVLNKIDQIEDEKREKFIEKMSKRILKALSGTCFAGSPIIPISATQNFNIDKLVEELKEFSYIPNRDLNLPLLLSVDHCFFIKGQGTICTGTILQGKVSVNDDIEIPHLKEVRKVKSIQMFRKSMTSAVQGDRIGMCITKIDSDAFERGLISAVNYLSSVKLGIINFNPIKYFRGQIKSKSKFHITIGHETSLATITLFSSNSEGEFNVSNEYEFIQEYSNEIEIKQTIFALLEFDRVILTSHNQLLIGSKLDMDIHKSICRLGFSGNLLSMCDPKNSIIFLENLKIYKTKCKEGKILRIINKSELISSNLFKKETTREMYIGMTISLTSGETGVIESTFGQSSKVKIRLHIELSDDSVNLITGNQTKILLKYKKYIFGNKTKKLVQ